MSAHDWLTPEARQILNTGFAQLVMEKEVREMSAAIEGVLPGLLLAAVEAVDREARSNDG